MDTASSNQQYGIRIYYNSDYNNITASRIENNTIGGIWLDQSGSNDPEFNWIWNNYLNNTGTYDNMRIDSGITNENYFNVTPYSGTNILGGPWIGGNYWTNSSGTGFSDTCTDSDVSREWDSQVLSVSPDPDLEQLSW